jgi:hypothetical protein
MNLDKYMVELKKELDKQGIYSELKPAKTSKTKYHEDPPSEYFDYATLAKHRRLAKIPSFVFCKHHDKFRIRVVCEGSTPTKQLRYNIRNNKTKFQAILEKLDGYEFDVCWRFHLEENIFPISRVEMLTEELGRSVDARTVERILDRMDYFEKKRYNNETGFFLVNGAKSFYRDTPDLQDDGFPGIIKSVEVMKELREYYDFCWLNLQDI